MDVLHLSDLHFGNTEQTFDPHQLAEGIRDYINDKCERPVLIVSGDVTFKGNPEGYKFAGYFFNKLIEEANVERERILLCPGNHDIVNYKFDVFDQFSYSIRRDAECCFDKINHNSIVVDDVLFYVINSSYHRDHAYGLIHDSLFKEIPADELLKVAITHHHCINMFEHDDSAIRNAYGFLNFLDRNGFRCLFHGHQHTHQRLTFGQHKTEICSVRSGNFDNRGYLNAMNHYTIGTKNNTAKTIVFEKSVDKIETRVIT